MGGVKVEVHIERLVLHGFKRGDRHRIGAALERELGRLLARESVGGSARPEVAAVDAGSFRLGSADRPGAIGARIAKSVHRGITRE